MDMDLRNAIISNIQDKSKEQLLDIMNSTVNKKEEKALPGLGVVFEIIWENSEVKIKENLIDTLDNNI